MKITIELDTASASSIDAAVLGALAPSLVVETGPSKFKASKITVKENNDAPAEKSAPAEVADAPEEAAEAPAAEAPKKRGPGRPRKNAKPAPEPVKEETPAEPAPAKDEPVEEPDSSEDESEDPMAEAVRLATQLVHDGRGAEVRQALKDVDAKRVSDLKGKALEGFLATARSL